MQSFIHFFIYAFIHLLIHSYVSQSIHSFIYLIHCSTLEDLHQTTGCPARVVSMNLVRPPMQIISGTKFKVNDPYLIFLISPSKTIFL